TEPATTATEPATTTTSTAASVTVFFPEAGGEALVRTAVPASGTDLRAALEALAAGPSGAALDRGLPAGTRILAADVSGGVATVDLSREFADAYPSGGAAAEFRALAPLVYTATGVDGVDAVRILVEGAAPDVPTQFDLSGPIARRDLPSPAEIR
ncbi:MAG: GerMN domain-containing protein, partial [Actinomycetota bacterium]